MDALLPFHDQPDTPHPAQFGLGPQEWRDANPWWSAEESGRITGRSETGGNEPFSPTPRQRAYLITRRLVIRWVESDGACNFAAVTQTVPPAELRDQIRAAAQRAGITVPAGADDIGWLLGQAAGAAAAASSQDRLRALIADALQSEGRVTEEPPAGPDPAAGLLDRAVTRLAAVPPHQPGDRVTGQQLRLLLAYL